MSYSNEKEKFYIFLIFWKIKKIELLHSGIIISGDISQPLNQKSAIINYLSKHGHFQTGMVWSNSRSSVLISSSCSNQY